MPESGPVEEGARGADRAWARAALWAVVAATLRDADDAGPPSADRLVDLEDAAALLDGDGGSPPLRDAVAAFAAAARVATRDSLADERARVYGHSVRGPCPPYGLEYATEHFLGRARRLGDLGALYGAFGVRVADDAAEREDHVAVEAEFLAFLCARLATALDAGDAGVADACRTAGRVLVAEHLGPFLPALAAGAEARAPGSLLARALGLAAAALAAEAARLGVSVGSPATPLREIPVPEEEMAISCGSGDPLSAATCGAAAAPREFEV